MNHPHEYQLPEPWESAVRGWLTHLTAAGTTAPSRTTRRRHVRSVARLLGTAGPRDVTNDDLLAAVGRPEHSIDHRRGLRTSLALFYRWAVKAGVVTADPAAELPPVRHGPATPRPATDQMWAAILATTSPRTLLMARLAAEAGLRRSEVAQVHCDDLIDTGDNAQLIVHGKGGKQRVVPITASLAHAIAAHGETGYLFPGKIDGHIGAEAVGKLVSGLMPPGYSIHKLRHRFSVLGYEGTHDLMALKEALGHASVATTQIYVAVSMRHVRSVVEAASKHAANEDEKQLAPVTNVTPEPPRAPSSGNQSRTKSSEDFARAGARSLLR